MTKGDIMRNLLLANDFFATYGMLIVLVVLVAALMLYSFSRKKKEDQYRSELSAKIVPGAKIKTYGGLYGTVVSVIDTTDGKLLVIKTGEGKNVSYQKIHINAVYGIDTSEIVTYDAEGNVVEPNTEVSAQKVEFVEEPETEVESEKEVEVKPEEKTEESTEETPKTTKAKKSTAKKKANKKSKDAE